MLRKFFDAVSYTIVIVVVTLIDISLVLSMFFDASVASYNATFLDF